MAKANIRPHYASRHSPESQSQDDVLARAGTWLTWLSELRLLVGRRTVAAVPESNLTAIFCAGLLPTEAALWIVGNQPHLSPDQPRPDKLH